MNILSFKSPLKGRESLVGTEKVLVSGLICPDGTVLYSRHRHDCQTHTDTITGEWMMIDGGTAYVRSSVNKIRGVYISLTTESPHSDIRQHFAWGTYGKSGKDPLMWVKLKDMEDSHIRAVLGLTIAPHITLVFENELEFRELDFNSA